MSIVNSVGGYSTASSAWGDLQAWQSSQAASAQSDIDLGTSLSGALSDALTNQMQGAGNLAAQAAAKRLGVSLPGSTSTSATGTAAAPANNASSVTQQRVSGVVNSAFGNDYVAQNITGTLATIDAITTGLSTISQIPTRALASYGSNYAAQNITGFLANLDQINVTPVNVTA